MKLAIYPGSFDPFTNGHKNILQQACRLFDKVIVAVATDNYKQSLFTTTERQQMIAAAVTDLPGVEVEIFEGLLVDFVCQKQAQAIIRGLRMVSDFEYEMQMAAFNKQLCSTAETVFLTSQPECCFISASFVRNIAALGGDVSHFVPAHVAAMLQQKYSETR